MKNNTARLRTLSNEHAFQTKTQPQGSQTFGKRCFPKMLLPAKHPKTAVLIKTVGLGQLKKTEQIGFLKLIVTRKQNKNSCQKLQVTKDKNKRPPKVS